MLRSGGAWTEAQKLTASDGTADDCFGRAVSLDGDTALVGAYLDDENGQSSGSAYVFGRSGSAWTEQQKLTASDGGGWDFFSYRLSLDGDIALVGAYGHDAGAVYAFVRSASTWTEAQKLTSSDGAGGDLFGVGVELDGDLALVGAQGDDDYGSYSGSAYVFARSGSGWTEVQKLTASDSAEFDSFGAAVALSGDGALVGAYGDDHDDGYGSAYVFARSGSVWTEQQKLTASPGAFIGYYGESVSIDGHRALVGAPGSDGAADNSGAAHLFVRSGSAWTEQQKLTASDGATWDSFGSSTVLDGKRAFVGASLDDDNGAESGSIYFFAHGQGLRVQWIQ